MATPTTTDSAPARQAYDSAVQALRSQLAALPEGAPVRLGKKTSNLFRTRPDTTARLDVSAFSGVLEVDPVARTADVLGMTTYEDLVAATLPYGLMPLVVPQLKTITLGGAVTGLGIESSSFRNGTPHESVLDLDILIGDGEVLHASSDNEHAALFFGFPNSYGTLGYALRLKIELEPVSPYVHLRHLRLSSVADAAALMREVCDAGTYDGERVQFVDGAWFTPTEVRVTLGSWADTAPRVSDYTGEHIYYRSVEAGGEDWLTVHDYLWRWDTDWFWCSRAFGAQNPRVRRLWPKRYLRSNVYWKIVALEKKHLVKTRLDRRRGLPEREHVVQDVEIPIARLEEFMATFAREVPIEPVWFCPLRQRDAGRRWPLWHLEPEELYVNVGFWSTVPLRPGQVDGDHNRLIERLVESLGGRKSLYSNSFYDEPEFWRLYGGHAYRELKKTYDPRGRLLDLYDKCVRNR